MSMGLSDPRLSYDLLLEVVHKEREAAQNEARQRRFSPIATPTLAWLAACEWLPGEVADALSMTQGDPSPVANLAEAGYLDPTSEQNYVVTDSGVEAFLDELALRPQFDLLPALRASAKRLNPSSLTPPQKRLQELITDVTSSERLAMAFERKVQTAIDEDDPNLVLDWIETGRPLAKLFSAYLDSSVDLAVGRAERRHELLRRRKIDSRHLVSFQKRAEQIDALDRLLLGKANDSWALHFIGSGGVGKTMLLRYITANVRGSIARIDFDYLNADYPRRNPGIFLSTFAEDLRLRDSGDLRATDSFDRAQSYFDQAHKRAIGSLDPSYRASVEPSFIEGVTNYILAMKALPQPVILILDTCEELMKVRPDGTLPESLEETFRILRALHDGPQTLAGEEPQHQGTLDLRVIFAGRRLLASAGHGWRSETSKLPPQSFLRLHELRGFTATEATGYLLQLGAPEELVQPILERSPEAARVASVIFEPELQEARRRRFNPYKLSFFGRWASTEPELAKEAIPSDSGKRYIEIRVLQSIKYDPLRRHLALIAQAKHVDRDFLIRATMLSASEVDAIIYELAISEWADARRVIVGDQSEQVISIRSDIQRELASYYNDIPDESSSLLGAAAANMRNRTETVPLADLDWTAFDATARLLRAHGDNAAGWWRVIETRALRERDFKWLFDVTSALLSEDGAAKAEPQSGNPLHAWVLASYASAVRHERRSETVGVWSEVLSAVGDSQGRDCERLRARAASALLAAQVYVDEMQVAQALDDHWSAIEWVFASDLLDVELGAAIVAAVENVIEHLERFDGRTQASQRVLSTFVGGTDAPLFALLRYLDSNAGLSPADALRVFLLTLVSRALLMTTQPARQQEALAGFERALLFAANVESMPLFVDWIAPDDLRSRVQLEAARHLHPAILGPDELLSLLGHIQERAINVDHERLQSRVLAIRTAERLPELGMSASTLDGAPPIFAAQCAAHRVTAPLVVTTAHVLAATGRVGEAIELLQSVPRTDADALTLREAERELLRLSRRMRLYEEGIGVVRNAELCADTWSLNALVGVGPDLSPEHDTSTNALILHAAWAASSALSEESRQKLLATLPVLLRLLRPDAQVQLDLYEADLLDRGPKNGDFAGMHQLEVDPETKLSLELRIGALGGDVVDIENLATRIGIRRAAEIALELGESLYLRLPGRSISLFNVAYSWFSAVGDQVGSFLSGANEAMASIAVSPGSAKSRAAECAAKAYEEIRQTINGPDMALLLRDPFIGEATIGSITPQEWRPWILRLLLVLLHAEQGRHGIPEGVRGLLRKSRGRTIEGKWRTSIDVEPMLPRPPEPAQQRAAKKRGWLGVAAIYVSAFAVFGALSYFIARWAIVTEDMAVAAAAVIFGGGILSITLVRKLSHPDQTDGDITHGCLSALLIMFFVFIVGSVVKDSLPQTYSKTYLVTQIAVVALPFALAFACVVSCIAWWSSIEMSKSVVSINVRSDRNERRASLAYTAVVTLTLVRRGVLSEQDSTIETTGFGKYSELIYNSTESPVWKTLKWLASNLGRQSVEVLIETNTADAGDAWEAVLAGADGDWPKRKRLIPRRVASESAPARIAGQWARPIRVLAWTPRSDLARSVTPIWTARGVEVQASSDPASLQRFARAGSSPVLQVIGTFEEQFNGIVVRGGGEAGRVSSETSSNIESAASLRHRFPSVELCFIQPEPHRGGARGEIDRQDALLARRFAAELFSVGVPVVIVLPRLQSLAEAAIVAPFATLLSRAKELNDGHLQRAIQECQSIIVSELGAGTNEAFEAMCDVALYCSADWRTKIS